MNLKNFMRTYQQALVLVIGYALVTVLAFGLGRYTKVQVPESITPPVNYSANEPAVQSASVQTIDNCDGKIKATASSKIYHLPGDSFYNRLTNPTCFNTEADAITAGYRKSAR